jgi:antitoxin CptB
MELAKLKWQCRRGSLELDILLQRYVDKVYLQADSAEQARFDELLTLDDEVLMAALIKLGA